MSTQINIGLQAVSKIVSIQEGGAGLSNIRFIQDTSTNLVPRAVFARSKADLFENSFLEISESLLVYYCPAILGERIFRKLYSHGLSPEAKKLISIPAPELLKNKANKALMPVKAAIALGCFAIPLTEFCLNYIKNGLTVKMFKQGNFNNVVSLEKGKSTSEYNDKVAKSAKKNIGRAAMTYTGCVAAGTALALRGKKSNLLQKISEFILMPGTKLFKNKKSAGTVNKYFGLDFRNNGGKLAMSNGQLTSCVLVGGAGYFGAAKDRGKQNFLETLYRFPLVGLYIICGNELLERGFKKLMQNKCPDLIDKNLNIPDVKDIKGLAEKLAGERGHNVDALYKKLLKQKTMLAGVPLLFGIGVMGFFVAGTSVLFTKYRYNKEQAEKFKTRFVSSEKFLGNK
ncbi:MAG: hypothetical protein LBJ74_05825 [Heliobacteriaceae bacterium]|jgi:hypothetical protein|nr:hypothetical protein [Heliobacteriaceae bacterium]